MKHRHLTDTTGLNRLEGDLRKRISILLKLFSISSFREEPSRTEMGCKKQALNEFEKSIRF